jgi:catechol 2,3-dioxygenase-like lactoylglutathione lyase family enzyme
MVPLGLHHVSFTVTELERSVEFYRRLGFTLERTIDVENVPRVSGWLRSTFLTTSGIRLELRQYEKRGQPTAPREVDIGDSHIALHVEDIDTWHRSLTAEGVRSLSSPQRSDDAASWWLFMLDPDGLRVELVQPDVNRAAQSGRSLLGPWRG